MIVGIGLFEGDGEKRREEGKRGGSEGGKEGGKGLPQVLSQVGHDLPGVRARAVQFIDKGDPRHVVTLHLSVDCDALGLDARYAAQDEDSAI